MFLKYKKIIILICGLGVIFLIAALIFTSSKGIKGAMTTATNSSAVKSAKVEAMTDEEKKDYLLTNPFTANDLMPFSVQSDSAIVFDNETGKILYAKNIDDKYPTASISKIITAVIAVENSKPDQLITISKNAADQIPNKLGMHEGEKIRTEDLLYSMMMLSANDCAIALAEGTLDYDNFVKAMNDKAHWLGLKNTNFTNPAGLDDPNHNSSAYDLGVITRYAFKKHSEILKYMGTLKYSIKKTDHNDDHYAYHVSDMIKTYPGMDGAKTGYTWEAGHTFIGTAQRDGKRLVVIVFNSQSPNSDISSLLDYGFKQ